MNGKLGILLLYSVNAEVDCTLDLALVDAQGELTPLLVNTPSRDFFILTSFQLFFPNFGPTVSNYPRRPIKA